MLDESGRSPLHVACMAGRVTLADLLLAGGADPNQQGTLRFISLHDALTAQTSELLDKEGRTPLHLACEPGHIECVKHLLERKADPDIKGTPPHSFPPVLS